MFLQWAMSRPLPLHCRNVARRLFSTAKSNDVTIQVAVPVSDNTVKNRMFTGIQPTGVLHLGNYLGVVKNWVEQQPVNDHSYLCISDMHSIAMAKDPPKLRENIFRMAASLLACGIDPQMTTLFVQSAVKEHSELCWILGTMSKMTTLGHQPMYMERTRLSQEMHLGIFTYPVMQAADILLYKATHIPIGDDQVQHVRFAQALAQQFNEMYGMTFPIFQTILADNCASRVRGLIDPSKKMSKSTEDARALIFINDEPDNIVVKINNATTDFASDVRYDPEKRVGISNLIAIHANIIGKTPEEVVLEAAYMDTQKYKNVVAEALIEHLTPIRRRYQDLVDRRDELTFKLDTGASTAHTVATETIEEVKQKLGMGAITTPVKALTPPADTAKANKSSNKAPGAEVEEHMKKKRRQIQAYAHIPVVPQQKMRGEKAFQYKTALRHNRFYSV